MNGEYVFEADLRRIEREESRGYNPDWSDTLALVSEVRATWAECARLRAAVEQLREALEPFTHQYYYDPCPCGGRDCRWCRARVVFAATADVGGEDEHGR